MRVVSVQVGSPRTIAATGSGEWWDSDWTSGFFKTAVPGPVRLQAHGLDGDGQADLDNHGGADKAVCCYPVEHYPAWQRELRLPEMGAGGFGENLTLEGLPEDAVCVGDIFRLGSARVQVSQPRQPCWKLARRWRVKDLALLTLSAGRTGYYLRVLEPGEVQAGLSLELLERPCPEWSVSRCNDIMHSRVQDRAAAKALAECPLLSESWRKALNKKGSE